MFSFIAVSEYVQYEGNDDDPSSDVWLVSDVAPCASYYGTFVH